MRILGIPFYGGDDMAEEIREQELDLPDREEIEADYNRRYPDNNVIENDLPSYEELERARRKNPEDEGPAVLANQEEQNNNVVENDLPSYEELERARRKNAEDEGPAVPADQYDVPADPPVSKLDKQKRLMQVWSAAPLANEVADNIRNNSKAVISFNKAMNGVKEFQDSVRPYNSFGKQESIIPDQNQIDGLRGQMEDVLGLIGMCKDTFATQNVPKEALFYMSLVEEKLLDDYGVMGKMTPGATLSEASKKFGALRARYGLVPKTSDVVPYRETPVEAPQDEYLETELQHQEMELDLELELEIGQQAPEYEVQESEYQEAEQGTNVQSQGQGIQNQRIPERNRKAPSRRRPVFDLGELLEEANKLFADAKKADPFYIMNGSPEYNLMKAALSQLASFVASMWKKMNDKLYAYPNKELKKDFRELTNRIENVMDSAKGYLDKKEGERQDDLKRGIRRENSVVRQPFEQTRIRVAIHVYANMSEFSVKMGVRKNVTRDQDMMARCNELLSLNSKRMLNERVERERREKKRRLQQKNARMKANARKKMNVKRKKSISAAKKGLKLNLFR